MKPTVEQVVAHFNLPDEAVGSEALQDAIYGLDHWFWCTPNYEQKMKLVNERFKRLCGCPITDYFKADERDGG